MVNSAPGGGYRGVLARMRGKAEVTDEESIADIIFRVAQTPEGDQFLTWVYQKTLGVTLPDDAPDGALRADAARKKFGQQIFNLVESGQTRWTKAKASKK
jgi:hypothetical protein